MKRLFVVIIYIIMLQINVHSEIIYNTEKVEIEKLTDYHKIISINKFYFSSLFLEELCCTINLYEKIENNLILEIGKNVYSTISNGNYCRVAIKNYDNNIDLYIIFKYKSYTLNGSKINALLIYSNYDSNSNVVIDSAEPQGNFFTLLYYLIDDKLIRSKYIQRQNEIPENDNEYYELLIANYYLFDQDKNNDLQIEQLLNDFIKKEEMKYEVRINAHIVLSQYYMMVGNLTESEKYLNIVKNNIEKIKNENDQSNIDFIHEVTEMELKLIIMLNNA